MAELEEYQKDAVREFRLSCQELEEMGAGASPFDEEDINGYVIDVLEKWRRALETTSPRCTNLWMDIVRAVTIKRAPTYLPPEDS